MSPLNHTQQQGFTLLELVLVMFIIALIASTPLLFIDEQDQQLRYEETIDKLALMRDAIYQRQTYKNQPLLSGFIVDNGVLPTANGVEDLFSLPADWYSSSLATPYFNFISSDASDAVAVTDFQLNKGHRGRYIFSGIDSSDEFRDGWGQSFIVSSSQANPATPGNVIIGAGASMDVAAGELAEAYAGNRPQMGLSDNSWQIPLSALNIQLLNYNTSEAIPSASAEPQRVAVLVFRNSSSGNTTEQSLWTSYHFDVDISAALAAGTPATKFSPTTINQWARNDDAADAASDYLPAGEHAVVVFRDDDNDTVFQEDEIYIREKLLVIPQSAQPTLTLTVSP